jgi:hypothetical protein
MKRIILLLAIALSSCSADETSTTPQEELNCNCSTILEANVFGLPTGQAFTAGVMENDCTGVQRNFNLNGVYRVGQKICN